jgi:hypothetical protein
MANAVDQRSATSFGQMPFGQFILLIAFVGLPALFTLAAPISVIDLDREGHLMRDGESVQLGNQTLTAHLTPGHTKGNTTWAFKIEDKNKTYDVVVVGSPSSLDYQFVGKESYPGITSDFQKTFAVL